MVVPLIDLLSCVPFKIPIILSNSEITELILFEQQFVSKMQMSLLVDFYCEDDTGSKGRDVAEQFVKVLY